MPEHPSRLGIFVFFDPQGIVDDYILYMLKAFRPHFSKLITISNCALDDCAKERLLLWSDALFIRENQGMDAAAFKDGLVSYCGWDEVEKYDEVILFNDTFFGPVHSFADMFWEMDHQDIDFWGMSAGYHSHDGWNRVKYGYLPDHIQTFFIAFRKSMVCTDAFQSYWNNYDKTLNDFVSVVSQHEVVMTQHFQDLGFRWMIYANTDRYRSKYRSENCNTYLYYAHTMMRDMKFPVLKKKALNLSLSDRLSIQDLEGPADAMNYIQNETDYNTKMIWDHALRLYNITDLYHSMHLNYVLPSAAADLPVHRKAALVFRVSNSLFAERFCKQASKLSALVDIYILPEKDSIRQSIAENLAANDRIFLLNSSCQQTEMGGFVLCCKELAQQYDYLGYVHDATNPEHYPTAVIESSVYGSLQNIANDPAYISQILNCFESNPRLGLLGAPFPIHHHGFSNYADGWAGCFEGTKKLAKKLGLSCNLQEEKPPFFITGNFWCRTDAICELWNYNWNKKQFCINPITNSCPVNDVLKRILPFAAQSQRYYSGIIMHTNYASMRLSGQEYMLTQIVSTTQTQLGCKSPRYKGYMEQLQAIKNTNDGSPLTIDLSRFNLGTILFIYLDQHAPQWLIQKCKRVFSSLKAFFRKH